MLQATWAVLGGDRLETAFMVRSSSSNVALESMIVNPPGWISEARDMVVPPRAACLVGKCRTIFSVRLWWLIIGKVSQKKARALNAVGKRVRGHGSGI